MVRVDSTRNRLIHILSENEETYISGQDISDALQISRNSVWKHMKALEKDGYVIEGVPRKGYRILKHPDKVSDNTIKWGLETEWLGQTIIHKSSAASTQQLIHQAAADGAKHGTVAILDEQTAGRGRMNREWHSAGNKGMWLSILLRPKILPQEAPQLTLLTATVLADVLKDYTGVEPMIKWPNDLLINKKKTAGILTEMQAEQDQIQYIVVGIGLNINHTSDDIPGMLASKATSLYLETGKHWSIQELIQQFLQKFEAAFDAYLAHGFSDVKKKWESYGFKIGEKIKIKNLKEEKKAIFHGIAEDGALLVLHDNGKEEKIYSGEIQWFE
ncbi:MULTISPECIES: biotin--[acetyl-CoA-carboxylase] ligase [Oceanobacillus]|uniref:biotin--[acetyl-CoA-carboxylase] ligase n=1 Tax=Oceanobacillus TaxID=182709 RepID=UPI0027E535D2|nr:biotin--[acetyl-CoA-carboxylase] ligase [Oceanobacillus indicireducens]